MERAHHDGDDEINKADVEPEPGVEDELDSTLNDLNGNADD
jgi:hypothetical protein